MTVRLVYDEPVLSPLDLEELFRIQQELTEFKVWSQVDQTIARCVKRAAEDREAVLGRSAPEEVKVRFANRVCRRLLLTVTNPEFNQQLFNIYMVGRIVRTFRERKKLTPLEVAGEINASLEWYANFEDGLLTLGEVSEKFLEDVFRALGETDVGELVTTTLEFINVTGIFEEIEDEGDTFLSKLAGLGGGTFNIDIPRKEG